MKNYFMEMLQVNGAIPEEGINYVEEVHRIGGMDNCPRFQATVGYEGLGVTLSGDLGEKKKNLLKRAWKELKTQYEKH